MGILILNTDRQIQSSFEDNKSEVVSLLIPEDTIAFMTKEERRKFIKNIPLLIKKYEKYLVSSKRIHKKAGKILYNRDQNRLKKLNLRMKNSDWNLLSVLASTHGVSRCFLVNYILWLDKLGMANTSFDQIYQGIPTQKSAYQFNWSINFEANQLIRKLQIEPNVLYFSRESKKPKPMNRI
ncbi:DUF1564 domain-containing protein [Leptospira sp. WS92.C1]